MSRKQFRLIDTSVELDYSEQWSDVPSKEARRRELMMEAVVEQAGIDASTFMLDRFSQVKNVLSRVFGCWHLELSLPFTRDNETYRTCVTCGSRRRFDLERWTMVGPFYRPQSRQLGTPASAADEVSSWKLKKSFPLNDERTVCHRK